MNPPFRLGLEEELLLVDPGTHALAHVAEEVLARVDVNPADGTVEPDTYAALVELATPIVADAGEGIHALGRLRAATIAAGGTLLGAGIHPAGAMGDVEHMPDPRYQRIAAEQRGLLRRTPTCAVHVHVGMPDRETTLRAFNGLRAHLPLLQALAANSPWWFGADSGFASARAQLFRGYSRADIPQAFGSWDEYEASVAAVVEAGDLPDYTFLWWDLRPHPNLGTVEVRAMDAQGPLWNVGALGGLVHALARMEAESTGPYPPREALVESSFRAARDGLGALLWHDGALRTVPEIARSTVERARPYARELGGEDALELVERLLREGGGADRQRRAMTRGGMQELLTLLVAETSAVV